MRSTHWKRCRSWRARVERGARASRLQTGRDALARLAGSGSFKYYRARILEMAGEDARAPQQKDSLMNLRKLVPAAFAAAFLFVAVAGQTPRRPPASRTSAAKPSPTPTPAAAAPTPQPIANPASPALAA